jgi:hypothetical protein
MVNNVLVNASMQGTRVRTARTAALGDNKQVVEVIPGEFRSLLPYYPIVLNKDPQSGFFVFVALCGLEPGENLMLRGETWSVPYVPINIRRQPFNILVTDGTNSQGASVRGPALSIDLDSPRVSTEDGEPMFDASGQATPFLSAMNDMMHEVYDGTQRGRYLAQRLDDLGLIEPMSLGFELADGQKHAVQGLYSINVEKFRQLPDETVLDMHRKDHLECVYITLASSGHIGGLIVRKNARLLAESQS